MQESDSTNREIKELQQRNNELQRLVDSLRNDCEELEEKHVIQTLREEMRALHDKHKQEAASVDASHRVGCSVLQLINSDIPKKFCSVCKKYYLHIIGLQTA